MDVDYMMLLGGKGLSVGGEHTTGVQMRSWQVMEAAVTPMGGA